MDSKSKKEKWYALKKEMLDMTGAPIQKGQIITPGMLSFNNQRVYQNGLGVYGLGMPSYNSSKPEPAKLLRLVIFFGFTGLLPMKFSFASSMSHEEITARMQLAGDKVTWKIMYEEEFIPILKQFQGTPNALVETTFEDAMNIIRAGVQKVEEEFVEADEDEFTDDCVESCKPGSHMCNK